VPMPAVFYCPLKWMRTGASRAGLPLSMVQLLSSWSMEESMVTLCSLVTGKMIIFPFSNRDGVSTLF